MSGSGSSVFGLTDSPDAATRITAQLEERWPWIATAPTVRAGEHMIFNEESSD
jgi:4-diphosphocytidyl-2C-methyl-D-erythritol kinase